MPKYEQSISLNNTDKETTLAICYQAIKDLKWTILYAGENKLLGSTPKSWKSNGQQILCAVEGTQLTISSEMTHGESFDLGGKNKKNVTQFNKAFEAAGNVLSQTILINNKQAIDELRVVTLEAAAEEQKQAAEVDAAMNLSGGNLYVTYAIMAINVLVFVLMAMNGAGIMEVNGLVHIKWGSNYTPLTLSGDWWRLVTNVFIHFGIIHLALNMYCLYTVGVYLEPMLGKAKYITAYLSTGILASLVSLWWHKEGVNSAGASGAIFGLYGLFLALLTTNLIPKQVRQPLLQSIGIFVAYNLFYGMKGGVDNAAHIGGLLSGFIIGYIYVYGIKKEKQEQKLQWIVPLIVVATLASAYSYLQQNKVSGTERTAELNIVKASSFQDAEKFNDAYERFIDLQDKALVPFSDSTISSDEALHKQLIDISLPQWQKAEGLAKEMQLMDVSEQMHTKATNVLRYIQLREEEITIFGNLKTAEGEVKLQEVRDNINRIVATLR